MKILMVVNDPTTWTFLRSGILAMGHEPVSFSTGKELQHEIKGEDPPRLALLEQGSSPENTVELIRQCRVVEAGKMYLILLTPPPISEQSLKLLAAGADDFIQTPVSLIELEARLKLGRRALGFQDRLMQQVESLKKSQGSQKPPPHRLLPICSYCKKIRDENGHWEDVEVYVKKRMYMDFSHSVCPDCMSRYYPWVDY